MDIKKANVNLLLGKVGELLKGLPDDAKKGDEFSEAEKALAKLQDLFAGQDGEIELLACRGDAHVING
ncbi:MAG: hypothetical protein KJ808_00590 [Acidobacteria bacterium]|nr:hypothetical protein [Acidobacteriota bacterium]MBU4308087.1 hypothetical protein [Acidobacteriota bacterium]MBU4405493.1 hypothetical protein [Acidobacteriota bacterium]MCG2812280.1 hypothetical protein [Candidatus Aminicenantes bacterium]MCJ7526300.1 hypothetical protein [Candidatus Aminicenantes bacterium]